MPAGGRIVRNGQLIVLKTGQGERRLRLFVYKVTGSSRGRPHERRIEITSTYQKSLTKVVGFQDVVLGYDDVHKIYVAVDPERIEYGGPTGNASSFFDGEGLRWLRTDSILIRPRVAKLFRSGYEYHAFIKPSKLAEYFFNLEAIHEGSYKGLGRYAGPGITRTHKRAVAVPVNIASGNLLVMAGPAVPRPRRRVTAAMVEAFERGNLRRLRKRRLTPNELQEIKLRCEENGQLGEEFVLNHERRTLTQAGRQDLAGRVRWVSQRSISEGFDILSYETDGSRKHIEVKSSEGCGRIIEMSDAEWSAAQRMGNSYYIYHVVDVRKGPTIRCTIRDPVALEAEGEITRVPAGWRIKLP